MNTNRTILLSVLVVIFVFLSEITFVLTHREVLSSYILKIAHFLTVKANAELSFFVLTQGKVRLPPDPVFKNSLRSYLITIPEKRDLPRVLYDLSVEAFRSGSDTLTPKLLSLAIARDPDFSFWRVELANYYLRIGEQSSGEAVLNECIKLPAPRKHCLDFKNSDLSSLNHPPVGFLEDDINNFYLLKNL